MAGTVKAHIILASDVRKLSMNLILRYLNGPDEEFRRALILKLATNVLPRINEHSGPEGGAIPLPLFDYVGNRNNNSNKEDTTVKESN